jgi:Fe2+ transport system protein FeoA
MSLYDAPSHEELKVVDIESGREAKQKLFDLGLHVDDVIVKLNNNKRGPVLLQNNMTNMSKLAIGMELAKKIIVSNGN